MRNRSAAVLLAVLLVASASFLSAEAPGKTAGKAAGGQPGTAAELAKLKTRIAALEQAIARQR